MYYNTDTKGNEVRRLMKREKKIGTQGHKQRIKLGIRHGREASGGKGGGKEQGIEMLPG